MGPWAALSGGARVAIRARLFDGARIVVHQRRAEGCACGVGAQEGGPGAIDGYGFNPAERPRRGQLVENLAQRRRPDLRVLFESTVDLKGCGRGAGSLGPGTALPVDEAGATARGAKFHAEVLSIHNETLFNAKTQRTQRD